MNGAGTSAQPSGGGTQSGLSGLLMGGRPQARSFTSPQDWGTQSPASNPNAGVDDMGVTGLPTQPSWGAMPAQPSYGGGTFGGFNPRPTLPGWGGNRGDCP